MSLLEQIKANREEILAIADKNGVQNLRIFGSVLHGEETENSDIDFLGEIKKGYDLFDLGGCQIEFQNYFGRKIDLVLPSMLHKQIKSQVIKDSKPI